MIKWMNSIQFQYFGQPKSYGLNSISPTVGAVFEPCRPASILNDNID